VPILWDASVAHLCRVVNTPGPEAWAACIALGCKPEEAAFQALERSAVTDDWRYRRIAVEAMAAHPLAGARDHVFIESLDDPSPYVVGSACVAVGHYRLTAARERLVGLLKARSETTRAAALDGLQHLWVPAVYEFVLSMYLKDPSKKVRRRAARALYVDVTPDTSRHLFDLWRSDPLHHHRVWACDLARRFGDPTYTVSLEDMLDDRDGHVRKAAQRALEELSERHSDAAHRCVDKSS
jgi:HEAT repeat protein